MVGRIRLAARFSDDEMRTISEICQILKCSPQDLTHRAVLYFTNEMADAIVRDLRKVKELTVEGKTSANKIDGTDGER